MLNYPGMKTWGPQIELVILLLIAALVVAAIIAPEQFQPLPMLTASPNQPLIHPEEGWRRTNAGWEWSPLWEHTSAQERSSGISNGQSNLTVLSPQWTDSVLQTGRDLHPFILVGIQLLALLGGFAYFPQTAQTKPAAAPKMQSQLLNM